LGRPPAEDLLLLREDLILEAVEEQGAAYYIIKDPVDQRFFRVKPLEHFLITQFDGATSLEEIRRRASEEHRVLVGPEVLERFAQKFVDLGLLVNPLKPAPGRAGAKGKSWRARVLYLKLPLANPEPPLDWLYGKLSFLLRPEVVALMALTIVFAVGLLLVNLDRLSLRSVVSAEGLLLIYLTLSVVTFLHELAHGLTCRHFGGRVQDMGVLLLYFVPCFYCNVSDAYLFKRKSQRLWVTFAGAYFELFLWALAVVGWRVVAEEAFLSRVLLIIVAVCGVRSLLNLNPLIKLDGYYLLADLLGIANLRKEALSGLSRFLRRRVLGIEVEPPRSELTNRSIFALRGDRFLALFGAAALAYTGAVLAYVLFWSGGMIFERYGGNGLGLFSLAVAGVLHKPAAVAASGARQAGKEKWQQLGKKKRRWVVLVWLAIPVAIGFIPWDLRIQSDLKVLPQERATVRAPGAGRVARIHFSEGQRVNQGDVLVEYDDKSLRLERETQQAELARAQEELRLLGKLNPTWKEEMEVEQRALETALALEAAARQELERAQQLWTLDLLPREKLERAQNDLEAAEKERRKQQARVELVRKQSRASRGEQMEVLHLRDPEAQKAVIARLEAEIKRLDDLLERTRVYAPLAGTVTTYRFQEKVGEFLEEGAFVCEIVDDEKVVIEMPVSEKDIDAIKVGYPVKFKVRGYPDKSFQATVAEIAPVATPSEKGARPSTILLRATVDNRDGVLKPDMTGVAKVYCGPSNIARVLTRDLIRFIRTEFWL
jgi:multidrug resistance efflux pump